MAGLRRKLLGLCAGGMVLGLSLGSCVEKAQDGIACELSEQGIDCVGGFEFPFGDND